MPLNNKAQPCATTTFHIPEATDGLALHRLIATCPPLDTNSVYCNLLHCTHFAATSILARHDGKLVGAVSGYLLPDDPHTLFVWQVAVATAKRGQGLASSMLLELLQRPACSDVHYLQTSVTPANNASRTLFAALAHKLSTPLNAQPWFERDRHFDGNHDDEVLLTVGPFTQTR